ncbi:MAG TPA: hypothetical protein VLX30_07365 [Burkholderiales bacterium]|nr:hypothetical protein [Burkholderiales bacterium]
MGAERRWLAPLVGRAGGLLVYGERVEGSLPDDKALSVRGADPHTVLTLRVEKRGEEYWASWGGGNRAAS